MRYEVSITVMEFTDARHLRLIEWLTTPPAMREPKTKAGLAEEFGVSPRTVRDWQARPEVRAAWEKRSMEVAGDPERVQAVLDELHTVALDRTSPKQVTAAKLYLEAVDAIKPPEMTVNVKDARALSDDELDALIARGAAELKLERAS